MKRLLKTACKWASILGVIYAGSLILSGLAFETRIVWYLVGLGLSIAYMDGTQKDRISDLQFRISELERQLNGRVQLPFND